MATDAAPVLDDRARYENIKKELMQSIPKKRAADKQLAALESEIYKLEGQYLQETVAQSGGNIVQGFDNFLKNQTTARRKYEVPDSDRIFSNSSYTIQRSLEMTGEADEGGDDSNKGIGPPTVTLRPTTSHENKLIRDREYSRRRRNKERAVTTDGDDESVSAAPTTGRQRKRARLNTDDD